MKTIYLKAQVPDYVKTPQIQVTHPGIGPGMAVSFTEIHLPTEDEINFLLTLINHNGKGEHYAYPAWESVREKLKTLKQI